MAEALSSLRQVAEKKALRAQGYDRSWSLVIYFNTGLFRFDGIAEAVGEGAAAATAGAKDLFRRIWVLWPPSLYVAWEDGVQGPTFPSRTLAQWR